MLDTIEKQPERLENYSEINYKSPEDFTKLESARLIGSSVLDSEIEINSYSLLSNYLKDNYNLESFNDVVKAAHDLDEEQEKIPAYELRRMPLDVFVGVLVESGVLSQELVDSGIIDRFSPDRLVVSENIEQYRGGFRHIFLGDIGGGLHDIDTLEDAGLAGEGKDTRRLSPTERGDRYRGKTGSSITENPDLSTGTAMDLDGDGDTDVVRLRRLDARSQFPEHWTTDQVIHQIVAIADTEGEQLEDNKTTRHVGIITEIIDGREVEVKITVLTDNESGLIENSYASWGDSRKVHQSQAEVA